MQKYFTLFEHGIVMDWQKLGTYFELIIFFLGQKLKI